MGSSHRCRYIKKNDAKDGVSASQALDNLFTRARDLQAIRKAPYKFEILLRYTITRSVQGEPSHELLSATDLPSDFGTLQTRLQQCIQKTKRDRQNGSFLSSSFQINREMSSYYGDYDTTLYGSLNVIVSCIN